MNVIEAQNVSKSYGKVNALSSLSLTVEPGSVYALLGPNGSGKTTFVKSVLGLVRPMSGKILINGIESTDPKSRTGVSYLPEKFNFFPYYTIDGVIKFYGSMKGIKGPELDTQCLQAMKSLGIDDLMGKKVKECSKGQLQRTGIAGMLMGDSNILILDEPFSGLDPIAIKELKDLLKGLKDQGKTLFINSHILSEMEKLCDHAAILDKGECLAQGELPGMLNGKSLEDFFYEKVKKC
ncbi:MAG: ABC transporter ATP-binding protein [Bacteriovoracaceae bacterium]|nr:ABC transporter ATP-binding protein [Bacteriovoracaceae bacterium]